MPTAGNLERVTPIEKLGEPAMGAYLEKSSSNFFQAKLSAASCQVCDEFQDDQSHVFWLVFAIHQKLPSSI